VHQKEMNTHSLIQKTAALAKKQLHLEKKKYKGIFFL